MSKPPKQPISNYLFHRLVLSDLGVNVNYDLPVRIPCPLPCVNTHDMFVAPDILFGAWFTCKHCGFAGDALELYKALSGCETMEDAISKQVEAVPGDCDIDVALEYYTNTTRLRSMLMGENVIRTTGRTVDLLIAAGLYGGDMEWLQPFLAVRSQKELKAMGLKGADIKGYSNIAVPCCDQPGRVRSVINIKADGSHSISRVSSPYYTNDDAGIAFLHAVRQLSAVRTLYVMEDVVMAAVLHRVYYMSTGNVLPLCAYTAGSDIRNLQYVDAAAVVMIPEHTNMASLETATVLADVGFDVYIADKSIMDAGADTDTLASAAASARKLDRVIAEYTKDTGVVPYFVNPAMRRKLTATVSDNTEVAVSAGQVRCGNRIVEDRPDGLYVVSGKRYKDMCVSNVKIITEALITVDGRRSPLCTGTLSIGSNCIEFSEYVSVINRAPAAWVRSQLHWFPKDTAEIHVTRWAFTNLCRIGIKLHAPEHYTVPAPFVLKHKDPKMMFPNFIVTDKEIAPRKVAGAFPGYPCSDMEYERELPWADMPALLSDDPAHEVLWALMICMIYNIISPYYGMRPMSFVLSELPEESTVLDWYTAMLNLPTARHKDRFTERTTTALKLDHRLPLHLQLQSNHYLVGAAAAGRHSPCVVSAGKFDADMLVTCPGWWAIDAAGAHRLLCSSDLINVIPEVVHAIFKQPYKVPADPLMHIAETMHAWLRDTNDGLTPNVLYKAVHRITTEDRYTHTALLATTLRHIIERAADGRIAPKLLRRVMHVAGGRLVIDTSELKHILHMLWPGASIVKAINLSTWLGNIESYTIEDQCVVSLPMSTADKLCEDTGVKFNWDDITLPQDDSTD